MNNKVAEAFRNDGYEISKSCPMQGQEKSRATQAEVTGYAAKHQSAFNHKNNEPKMAYYLEGSAYQMGYQLGSLEARRIKNVVKGFIPAFLAGYIHGNSSKLVREVLKAVLTLYVDEHLDKIRPKIPQQLLEEMQGLEDGLKASGVDGISSNDILRVNVAQDALLSRLCDPLGLSKSLLEIAKKHSIHHADTLLNHGGGNAGLFKLPRGCHAFSAFDGAVSDADNHFFGRDWMFSGGWWLANNAALVIYNPNDGRKPLVSATVTGLVGSLLSVSADGIAMGVDNVIVPRNKPKNPGFNSTLLIRHCIHNADSAAAVVGIAEKARRGASYLYPVSDGSHNTACTIEATGNAKSVDPYARLPHSLRELMPTASELDAKKVPPIVEGMVARWSTDKPQTWLLKYNKGLYKHFDKPYDANAWGVTGMVFSSFDSVDEAFGPYFFNPVRLTRKDLHITTNAAISPRMRLLEMYSWGAYVTQPYWTDFQWRYDTLNNMLQKDYGKLTWSKAWRAINFISPASGVGKGKQYYFNPDWSIKDEAFKYEENGVEKTSWAVPGMVTLSELRKTKKVRALFGTYADQPVEITLPNYL